MADLGLDDLNLPIALRRTRRTGTGTVRRSPTSGVDVRSAIRNNKNPAVACTREVSPPTPPTTPRRNLLKNKITKTKATVRGNKTHYFSTDTGMQLVEDDELSLSTGLTPIVQRTSLQPPSPAPKCLYKSYNNTAAVTPSRRRSAPTRLTSATQPGNTSNPDLFGAEATSTHLLPLRQSHHKRRSIQIRRNASLSSALSEEKMNRVYTERRKREKEAQEEIERLRAELKEKNETIERFQNDDTVELELPLEVVAGRVWELERERAARQAAVAQQPRSPETPSNPTFHTALSMRQGEDRGGNEGDDGRRHMGMDMALDHPHRHHYDPGSGSETEALSLTASQFGAAIRAQLDCSTPPPSSSRARYRRPLPTTTATAAARVGIKPFPSPSTTSPMGMAMAMMPVTGPGTELPITPCSNSRHGETKSALSSRRTSDATTIHIHHNLNEELHVEETPTRASGSASSLTHQHQHQHHHHHQEPSSSSSEQQRTSTTQAHIHNHNHNHNQNQNLLFHSQLQTLTTQNTTLEASLSRTQRSLSVALQMVKKLQMESEQLRGETLFLQREKRELMEVVGSVQGMKEGVREVVRKALERRDEMWKGKMRRLGEGIVEGVRGVIEEVIEE
ncbi:hypothetical protein N0V85_009477, partial [Neurospora sp. IMI 360204]